MLTVTADLPQSKPVRQVSLVASPSGGRVRGTEPELPPNVRVAAAPPALLASVRQLMILRTIAISGQTAAITTSWYLGVSLPLAVMAFVVGALIVLNALTWMRLRSSREASHAEIAAYLGFDLTGLTLLLLFSGGVTNPFCLLFVLHVVLMALLLPPLATASGTVLVIACYVALTRFHAPLEMRSGDAVPAHLLTFGWWLSFMLTAGVVAWFVMRIVATLRDHERLLSEAAQRTLRDDAVLRVGALAAGAAHELATPLTTMALAAGEIARHADSPSLQHDAGILTSQIKICRETIANLMAAAGHARAVGGGRERLDQFLESIAVRCRTMRPEANIVCDWGGVLPAPEIFAEQALMQALLALLNNAVDASPKEVQFAGYLEGDALRLSIIDRGSGLPAGNHGKLGRTFFTTKPPGKGTGLGVVLASRAIERLHGTLCWEDRPGGGTRVKVMLPIASLSLEAHG
jgi:two-component system, sensor histidine kinase RegB